MGGVLSLHHGWLVELLFKARTHVQQPSFPGTWAIHGPRGRTTVFQHERLDKLLFLPHAHLRMLAPGDLPNF
jgi:hypothetical protein